MNKLLVFGVIAFLGIALVSAVLTPLLSNETSLDFSANSPIEVKDKINSESYLGGQTINYKGIAINHIEKQVEGFYTLKVSNSEGTATCDDFVSVVMKVENEPTPITFNPNCVDLGNGELMFQHPISYSSLQNKTHYAELELALNIKPAEYEVKGSVMNLAYS